MRRGQAFDTFKLMIAAVVAVAILGILLGILGGISFSGQGFGNTAKSLLSTCSRNPVLVKPSAGQVNFQGGTIYPESMFTTASGGRSVKFMCNQSLINNGICSVASNPNQLQINKNFHTKIKVCCDTDTTGTCEIGISSTVSCT